MHGTTRVPPDTARGTPPGPRPRASTRERVALAVRFTSAREFTLQYTENLSHGGLFVAGAQALAVGAPVMVELVLPGFGIFLVEAAVVHTLAGDKAGQVPGAGLRFTQEPAGFNAALDRFLGRIKHRRAAVVMVAGSRLARTISDAGYQVQPVPALGDFVSAVLGSRAPVLSVLMPGRAAGAYEAAGRAIGLDVLAVDDDAAIDGPAAEALLRALDAKLP